MATNQVFVRRYLKLDAVPSVFPNAPTYLSKPSSLPRSTVSATCKERLESEVNRLNSRYDSFVAEDNLEGSNLDDIANRLRKEKTPEGYHISVVGDKLLLYFIETINHVPNISCSVTICRDLSVKCSLRAQLVPISQYKDLYSDRIRSISQILNLMARVKSWCTDSSSRPLQLNIKMAVSVLQLSLQNIESSDSEEYRRLSFLIEQLKLLAFPKPARTYSPQLAIWSYLIFASSSAAYNTILTKYFESSVCNHSEENYPQNEYYSWT